MKKFSTRGPGKILRRSFFSVNRLLVIVCVSVCLVNPACVLARDEKSSPLPSWNEGDPKQRIINFVNAVSDPSDASFVSPEERIAVFDLDGTLFCEKPLYVQVLVAAQGLYDLAAKRPELRDRQPYKAAWEHDMDYISDPENFLKMNLTAFEGWTQEEYMEYVMGFLSKDHPVYGVPYLELLYAPMLELLKFLSANGFQVYIVSGSPQAFIRSFSQGYLNIEPERVIGDAVSIEFRIRNGMVVFIRRNALAGPETLKKGKPENIRLRTGRSAILAFGNSNDDIEMLESADAGGLPHLSLLLHHDDKGREYAYDKGAERLLEIAPDRGWVIVSMKDDFKTIFEKK